MKVGPIVLAVCLSVTGLKAQGMRYEQLLKLTKEKGGLILHDTPPSPRSRLASLKTVYEVRNPKYQLSTELLDELIDASERLDSSKWITADFSRTVVVKDKSKNIKVNKIVEAWGLTDKAEVKKYKQRLRDWVNTDVSLRYITYLSRPVLTDDEEYGVIVIDDVEGNLCCGGQLILYKYEAGRWTEIGPIHNWKY